MCPADGKPGHPQTEPRRPLGSPGEKSFPSASPDLPTPCHRHGPCRDQLHTHPTCHGHPVRTDPGTEASDADPLSIRLVLLVGTCSECQASLAVNVPCRRNPRWEVSGGELCPRCRRRLGDGGGGQGQHYDRTSPSPPGQEGPGGWVGSGHSHAGLGCSWLSSGWGVCVTPPPLSLVTRTRWVGWKERPQPPPRSYPGRGT